MSNIASQQDSAVEHAIETISAIAAGQQTDGTFAASISRTVPHEQEAALEAVADAFAAHLRREPDYVHRDASQLSALWRLVDGESLVLTAGPSANGRTGITATQSGMQHAADVPSASSALSEVLGGVAD